MRTPDVAAVGFQQAAGVVDFFEADLKRELASLVELLGDTRVRFRHRQTPFLSSQGLIDVDRQIGAALKCPPSAELQTEVRRLSARLRALDPNVK